MRLASAELPWGGVVVRGSWWGGVCVCVCALVGSAVSQVVRFAVDTNRSLAVRRLYHRHGLEVKVFLPTTTDQQGIQPTYHPIYHIWLLLALLIPFINAG